MDGLGLGAVILAQRKRQGWTQEDLAARIGVSKGAVSKWETGQSYPDLPLVPRLAALFHITVDELLDYRPQLSREEIRRLHRELSREFAERPFPVACAHCRELAAQYASCAPLLLQLGSLFLNYLGLAGKPQPLLQEALALFSRAQEVSQDAYLCSEARNLEAYCLLCLDRPQEALSRLGEDCRRSSPSEAIQAMAYSRLGQTEKARQVLQVGIYNALVLLFNDLGNYLQLCQGEDFPPCLPPGPGAGSSFRSGTPPPWIGVPPLSAYGPRLDKERRERPGAGRFGTVYGLGFGAHFPHAAARG